jgi:hypothetical protein
MVQVNNLLAAGALCCTLIGAAYGTIITPLQHEVEKQGIAITRSIETESQARMNTLTLGKQDIRIEQNDRRIQLGEINAAKREVQMEHLTDAIKELTEIIRDRNTQ